ncbi:ankyrin repeat-containing domain protein [Aspergillus lucknowensis]|uniref:Ankyrin repeat-containing domain protein n=1 Tax=Aspergillus lucknowensis TaxID=176173 RepID=A0ABR4M4U7_9EURO
MSHGPIWRLPNELLIHIATGMPSESDINALILTHPRFHALLNKTLYTRNATCSESSALLWAAKHGNLETTKKAIAASNARAGEALTAALENKQEDIAEALLRLVDGIDTEVESESYGHTPLCLAAAGGYGTLVRSLLARGADVNFSQGRGESSLPLSLALSAEREEIAMLLVESSACVDDEVMHVAVCKGREAMVKVMLEKGGNVNAEGGDDDTVLIEAAMRGHEGIVNVLLEAGATVDYRSGGYFQTTALCEMAGHDCEATVRKLVERGGRIDDRDEMGETPLMRAARNGREAVARLLIEKGSKINDHSNEGVTVLMHAAAGGHEGMTRLLLENGADMHAKDNEGRTLLHWAAKGGRQSVLELYLKGGADPRAKTDTGETVTLVAAEHGDEAMLAQLLALDPNIGATTGPDECGEDRKRLGDYGDTMLGLAARSGRLGNVKLLVGKGAALEAANWGGYTPLALAASWGHPDCVEFLLNQGASVANRTKFGTTPLGLAASRGSKACVELLLNHGADLEAKDKKGKTPLSEAAEWGREDCVELLLGCGAEIEVRDERGWTPLSLAVYHGRTACAKILIQYHANIEAKDKFGCSPLLVACSGAMSELANHRIEIMELLLDSGADIESTDSGGRTALARADRWPPSTRQFLRDRGANVKVLER